MEIILIQKKFLIILMFQYLMFKKFFTIDFRTPNVYWDALFIALTEGERCTKEKFSRNLKQCCFLLCFYRLSK